jgi:hypothetical protein
MLCYLCFEDTALHAGYPSSKLQQSAQSLSGIQSQSGVVESVRDDRRVQYYEAVIRLLHTNETAVPLHLPQQSELSCLCGCALCVRVLLLCSLLTLLPLLQQEARRDVPGPHQVQTGQFLRVVDLWSRAQPASICSYRSLAAELLSPDSLPNSGGRGLPLHVALLSQILREQLGLPWKLGSGCNLFYT